jgi:hypothetical protein
VTVGCSHVRQMRSRQHARSHGQEDDAAKHHRLDGDKESPFNGPESSTLHMCDVDRCGRWPTWWRRGRRRGARRGRCATPPAPIAAGARPRRCSRNAHAAGEPWLDLVQTGRGGRALSCRNGRRDITHHRPARRQTRS